MEKRAILAAVLMAGLLLVYQTFFLPVPPPSEQQARPKEEAKGPVTAPAPAPPAPATAPGTAPTPAPAPAVPAPRPPQRTVTVDAPLYHAVLSSEGGKLQEWNLKYRGTKPMVMVGELGPLGLVLGPNATAVGAPFSMSVSRDEMRL